MRSALLRRKIKSHCVRLSVSSAAGSYGKRQKVLIITNLHRRATSGGRERQSHGERSSRGYPGIPEAAMPRTVRSGGVSGTPHRTTVRDADLIEGIADSLSEMAGSLFQFERST